MRSRPGPETISGPGAHAGKQGRPRQRPGARQALDRQSAIGIVPSRYVSTTWPSGPVRGRRRSARGRWGAPRGTVGSRRPRTLLVVRPGSAGLACSLCTQL